MKTRFIVSGLIKKDGKYLFIRQNKVGGAYPNTLHLPGGGIDDGEMPDEAIRREFLEEVGVQVTNLKSVDFDWDVIPYKGEDTIMVFLRFVADYLSGTPSPGSDAKELVWVAPEDILISEHNPPSLRFLRNLGLIS